MVTPKVVQLVVEKADETVENWASQMVDWWAASMDMKMAVK